MSGLNRSILPARNGNDEQQVRLSARELEIAELVYQGCSNHEIGEKLGISRHTVGTYITRVFQKLGVHTRAAMTAKLSCRLTCEQGLCPRDSPQNDPS